MGNNFSYFRRIKAHLLRFVPVVFLVIAMLFGLMRTLMPSFFEKIQTVSVSIMSPVFSVLSAPVYWVKDLGEELSAVWGGRAENRRLKEENEKLKSLENELIQLTAENEKLQRLLNFVPPTKASSWTGRIIADDGNAFTHSVLIQLDDQTSLPKGTVALTDQGVFGRVVFSNQQAARVVLITDFTSRIPVKVGAQEINGILAGDNTDFPKLTALPEGAVVQAGDRVITSGIEGVYPEGLSIGVVLDDQESVRPFVKRSQTSFVRLVDFKLSGLLPDDPCPVCEEGTKK